MKLWERILTVAVVCMLIAAMAFSFADYRRSSERAILDGIHASLQNLARERTRALASGLSAQSDALGTLAECVSRATDEAGVVSMLAGAATSGAFERAAWVNADGLGILSDGTALDARESDYYRAALAGERYVSESSDPVLPGLLLSVPIMREGRLQALAVGTYSFDRISELLEFDAGDSQSYSFIADSDGRILINAPRMNQLSVASNALEFYREAVLENGANLEAIEYDLKHQNTGSFAYSYGNQYRYAAYAPLGYGDWFVFIVMPGERVEAQMAGPRRGLPVLAVRIAACAILLFAPTGWRRRRLVRALAAQRDRLRRSETMRSAAGELSYTILFEVDPETGALHCNEAFERQLGRKLAIDNLFNLDGSHAAPEDVTAWRKLAEEMKRGVPKSTASVQIRHQNGALLWYRVSYVSLYDDGNSVPYRILGRIANIERQDHEGDAPDTRPGSDPLTGLMGHRAFMEQAERMLPELKGGSAMMVVDIDGFKEARDPLGRVSGEQLLVLLSEAMRRLFGPGDLLGRLGGDTFAVLMTDAHDQERIARCAQALCDVFEDVAVPFGQERLTCSVGVALVDAGVDTMAELSRRADHALYRAKLAGKHRFEFYDAAQVGNGEGVRGRASDAASVLLRCATALLTEPLPAAMDVVLSELAGYYRAERAYVLELDAGGRTLTESYAWNARGALPHENGGLAFELSDVKVLGESLNSHKPVVITESAARKGLGDIASARLTAEHIQSIYLMPLGREGRPAGFIGLDNPTEHVGSVSLLKSLANCVYGQLAKNKTSIPTKEGAEHDAQ